MDILLIEPDKLQAAAITTALVRTGHTVRRAASAQHAVHAADERAPELVILELQLAQQGGIEFLYEFRSYSEWLHIPIVLYTHVPASELAHATTLERELGVVCTLYKPATSLAQLCAAVQKCAPEPVPAAPVQIRPAPVRAVATP